MEMMTEMAHRHIKSIEYHMRGNTYELEIDAEDPDNLVIETVTLIDGFIVSSRGDASGSNGGETDIDPEEFQESLDDDNWVDIKEKLDLLRGKK